MSFLVLIAQGFFDQHLSAMPKSVEDIETFDKFNNSVNQTKTMLVTEAFETKETLKKSSPLPIISVQRSSYCRRDLIAKST